MTAMATRHRGHATTDAMPVSGAVPPPLALVC